jgi:DNA-binding GntR family transcriptional regulator
MVSSVSASTNPHSWRRNGAARINRAEFRNRAAFGSEGCHRTQRRRHDDHHRIYEAIIAGEPWRAEWLMREHVSSVKGSLIRAPAARNGDQTDQAST